MKIAGIIPARYASTRFPGKPLVMIGGKSMIRRVYEQVLQCKSVDAVIVATDSSVIEKHVLDFGGKVVMTSNQHTSGTERCAEVVAKLNLQEDVRYDAVINIQGDEPFIDPAQVDAVATLLAQPGVQIATLGKKLTTTEELTNPNVVKLVKDLHSRAIYFSRSAIPFQRGREVASWIGQGEYFKHVGIYGYHSDTLLEITALPPSDLEMMESLEQLRWLENGYTIHIGLTDSESISIDIPEDLLKITNKD
jgi:3-deoxy-manno-octulosonate cytidylyltransferase (CMP-KDO synthetase)